MPKTQKNKQIERDYEALTEHLQTVKFTVPAYVVRKPKPNHPHSFYNSETVTCDVAFGNASLDCEIRHGNNCNYSISYMTDRLDNRTITRLDAGDGTHNNRAPGIPLALTSVPTPHIHKYRPDGYFIAYPIDGIDYDSESSLLFDCKQGYDYLCKELNICSYGDGNLTFEFSPEGLLPLEYGVEDPNEGVNFGIIEAD